jgi:hypothetical protein
MHTESENMSVFSIKEDDFIVTKLNGNAWKPWKVKRADNGDYRIKAASGVTWDITIEELLGLQARLATRDEIKWFYANKLEWLEQSHTKKIARIRATIETLE